jgi:predicted MFS family arabinose efflux permease
MQRKWLVLIAVSVVFFFISAATFMSLGVLLGPMAQDLHWSQTEAGAGYTALGLSCCLSSLLPMALAGRIGMRWTMMLGGLLLAAGFLFAAAARDLGVFLSAAILMGVGFTLTANIPGVYLLARWFPARSGRVIGAYLMCGAFGGVAGPPIAHAVAASEGWRAWWGLLTVIAAGLSLLCVLLIRDTEAEAVSDDGSPAGADPTGSEWRYRDAVLTPQFAILALGMVITEACVTVVHSAAVIHFGKMGLTPAFATLMLSLQALMATSAKGASGAMSERINPRLMLAGGLGLEAVGMILLASVHSPALAIGFALAFGIGWGTAYLTITVLLINYFGPRTGSAVLSLVWLLTAFASLYPTLAGFVADRFGSFSLAFDGGGALLAPIALAVLVMRRPLERAPSEPRLIAGQARVADGTIGG